MGDLTFPRVKIHFRDHRPEERGLSGLGEGLGLCIDVLQMGRLNSFEERSITGISPRTGMTLSGTSVRRISSASKVAGEIRGEQMIWPIFSRVFLRLINSLHRHDLLPIENLLYFRSGGVGTPEFISQFLFSLLLPIWGSLGVSLFNVPEFCASDGRRFATSVRKACALRVDSPETVRWLVFEMWKDWLALLGVLGFSRFSKIFPRLRIPGREIFPEKTLYSLEINVWTYITKAVSIILKNRWKGFPRTADHENPGEREREREHFLKEPSFSRRSLSLFLSFIRLIQSEHCSRCLNCNFFPVVF